MHIGKLPLSISSIGYLPKPTPRNIFINNNPDKRVEIIVQVNDMVDFSNNKVIGYWINNKKIENLLNLELVFRYVKFGNSLREVTLTKNLTKDFLGNFEEYIKNYAPHKNAKNIFSNVPFFYKFTIGASDGLPSNFDHNDMRVRISSCKVCFNDETIRSKEGFESFDTSTLFTYTEPATDIVGAPFGALNSVADINSRIISVESDDIFENLKNIGNLTQIDTLGELDLKEPEVEIEDCISNLRTTRNHLGHVVGFFSLDVEKFFELTNPYDKLLNNISPLKKGDIINDLKNNEKFINLISIDRIRLAESAKLRPGRYEPVFNPANPPVKITSFNPAGKGHSFGTGDFEKLEGISCATDRPYLHFSFVDKSIATLNAGKYKYKIAISSDTSSVVKNRFEEDIKALINNLDVISLYHETVTSFGYNSMVERFSLAAVQYFVDHRNLLRNAIVQIMVKLAGYAKSSDTATTPTTEEIGIAVDSAMAKLNPRKTKPEYMHKFINDINSKISTLLSITGVTPPQKTDDNESGIKLSPRSSDQYTYTFRNEVEAREDNAGLEFFQKTSDKMLRITRQEYDSRIKQEKGKYNAGSSQSSDTFWHDGVGYTFLTPYIYRDRKNNPVTISGLSAPSGPDLTELIKSRGLFENLPLLKVTKEVKQSKVLATDLTSYLEKISILKGISFNEGDNALQGKETDTKTRKEQNLSRLGIYNLKNEIQATTHSPFGFGVKDGIMTDLKGGKKEIPSNFSFKEIPQHFRYQVVRDDRVVIDPPFNFKKCENSFSQGLGSLFYYLTYGQIRKVEYLVSKSSIKDEEWQLLTYDQLSNFNTQPLFCRIVEYTNDAISFKTATDAEVNNHYFFLTPEGSLATTESEDIQSLLEGENLYYTLNSDGTVTINQYSPDSSQIARAAGILDTARNWSHTAHTHASNINNMITSAKTEFATGFPAGVHYNNATNLFNTVSSTRATNEIQDYVNTAKTQLQQTEENIERAKNVDYGTSVEKSNQEVKKHTDQAQKDSNQIRFASAKLGQMETDVSYVLGVIQQQKKDAIAAAMLAAAEAAAAQAAAEKAAKEEAAALAKQREEERKAKEAAALARRNEAAALAKQKEADRKAQEAKDKAAAAQLLAQIAAKQAADKKKAADKAAADKKKTADRAAAALIAKAAADKAAADKAAANALIIKAAADKQAAAKASAAAAAAKAAADKAAAAALVAKAAAAKKEAAAKAKAVADNKKADANANVNVSVNTNFNTNFSAGFGGFV